MTSESVPALTVVALTAAGDPIGGASPLTGLHGEGLAAALRAEGLAVHTAGLTAARVAGSAGYRDAAEQGKALAARASAQGLWPDVVLCDGYRSGFAAHALAGAIGGRVALWLGTQSMPTDPAEHRLAVAVARSSALLASTPQGAIGLRRLGLGEHVEVVAPPVDPALISEPQPWHRRARPGARREPGAGGFVVAVCAPPAADPDRGQRVEPTVRWDVTGLRESVAGLIHRMLPMGRTRLVDPAAEPQQLAGVDVAVTGLVADGGRSTLRAMAGGVAVISLSREPDRHLIVDRASGVEAADGPALAAAVRELQHDPFLREALGAGAIDKVRTQHSSSVVARSLSRVLAGLIEATDRRNQESIKGTKDDGTS